MKLIFNTTFQKDAAKLPVPVRKQVRQRIQLLEDAAELGEIPTIKKLKGHPNAYRLRIGDYRVGFFKEKDTVVLTRVLHRKDLYKKFP